MGHTPGPWRFDGHGINAPDGTRLFKYQAGSGRPYLNDGSRDFQYDEDSMLVAAAPELLASCEAALEAMTDAIEEEHGIDCMELEDPLFVQIRAAIAKARGEAK